MFHHSRQPHRLNIGQLWSSCSVQPHASRTGDDVNSAAAKFQVREDAADAAEPEGHALGPGEPQEVSAG